MALHATLKPLKEFSFPSADPYLLDMFGGVFSNPSDPGNPLIECLMTPCIPKADGSSGLSRRVSEQVRVGVGAGNLTNLHIGRFVLNGSFSETSDLPDHRLEKITFEIDTQMSNFAHETYLGTIPFEASSGPLSFRQAKQGVLCPVKLLSGTIIETDKLAGKASPIPSRDMKVVIHELELIRYYYVNSSNLCRAVFSEAFTDDQIGSAIFAGSPIRAYDEKQDIHAFTHRQGFIDEDMPILGRILFEPNELALRGVRRIYQSMRASRLSNPRPDMMGYPRTNFPFAQKVRLTLTGHRCRLTDASYVFVAHHIDTCSSAFPFRRLEFASVRATGIVDRDMLPETDQRYRPRAVVGPAHLSALTGGFNRSDMQPAADSIAVSREVGTRLFLGLAAVTMTRALRTVSIPVTSRRVPEFRPSLKDWSTGKPGSGTSTAARLLQKERVESGELPADLESFISVIQSLRSIKPQWEISFEPAGDKAWKDASSAWRGFFPLVNCITRRSLVFKFSYVDPSAKVRRQLICVQIEVRGAFVYLLEAQRRIHKDSKTGKVQYMDALPVLLIRQHNWSPIDQVQLDKVLKDTVSNPSKTWPNQIDGYARSSVDHGNGADTAQKLAQRIAVVVEKFLPDLDQQD